MDCTQVKPGWYCAGEAGHDGPCAAWPPCFFCGYLGPGLEPYPDLNSICQQCIKDYIAASGIRPGDAHGAKGDQIWDGTLWDRIKFTLGKWFWL